jgi:integrase/recombinase XerD
LLRGATLDDTKRFMRHKDLSSTLIYAHHIDPMKDDSEDQIEKYILKEDSFFDI